MCIEEFLNISDGGLFLQSRFHTRFPEGRHLHQLTEMRSSREVSGITDTKKHLRSILGKANQFVRLRYHRSQRQNLASDDRMFSRDRRNVAILINSLTSGGAERNAVMLCEYLLQQNYRVTVITRSNNTPDFYRLPAGVRRGYIRAHSRPSGRATSMLFQLKGIPTLCTLFELRRILIRDRIDVLIGMMTTQALLSILAAVGTSTRVIVSERNYPGEKHIAAKWEYLRFFVYRFADAHVAQTHTTEHWLRTRCGVRRVAVIPNPLRWPLPRLEPVLKPESFVSGHEKVVLGVGSLSKQKGFDLLIRAFAKAVPHHPGWKLFIIGGEGNKDPDGSRRADLEHLVEELGMRDRILLPGLAGNISDWYERTQVFALSSRYEGFPNVLIEAMASGCACVSFDCKTGPRDLIIDGINGILVPVGGVGDLTHELERLMRDDTLRTRLSTNAVSVRDVYSRERVLQHWEALIWSFTNGYREMSAYENDP